MPAPARSGTGTSSAFVCSPSSRHSASPITRFHGRLLPDRAGGRRHTVGMRVTTKELLRLRLSSQRIESSETFTIADIARQLFATQAQDFIQAGWALGLRARGSTLVDLLTALETGAVIRSAPFRGTLHFMPAEELGWVLGVTAERTVRGAATRLGQLGLDARALSRARDFAAENLAGGRTLTRDEFFVALRAAGIDPAGQRGYNLIWYLAQTGVVCWGPPRGTQQGLVLLDEWVRSPRRLVGDEALRELALRYFTGHGPATERDFAWWTKLTLRDVRTGIHLARSELTEIEHDGRVHFAATAELERAGGRRMSAAVHALPGFDEFLLGYEDRSAALAAEHSARIVPGNNGIFLPMIIARGEVVGTWRRTERAAGVTVAPDPFSELSGAQGASFAKAAAAFARFRAIGSAAPAHP
jgi:hypothetical protein